MGENSVEPGNLLVNVEISDVVKDSIGDDIKSFRPGIVLRVERVLHSIDDHGNESASIFSITLSSDHAFFDVFVLRNANTFTKRPFIGSMCFGDVDGEEVGNFVVGAPQGVDGRCGDSERGSGVRARNNDEWAVFYRWQL